MSKRYFSNYVLRIPSKLYEDIAYHRGIQAITLLGNRPNLTKFMVLCEILTWESLWGNLKCEISRKRLIIQRN